MANYPIVDLHNDLLSYLTHEKGRTPFEEKSRSSITQMKAGGMLRQVLVIWVITSPGCVKRGERQLSAYQSLIKDHPQLFSLAIENASAIAEEGESMEVVLARLEKMGPLVYISLTWDGENRFGGGNATNVGLKGDGEALLRWMHGRKIAVDLSHTSDRLAFDIMNFIDQNNLKIPLIASHSNFRDVQDKARNLPKEIAEELIRRKGLVGLNFFAPFIGKKGIYSHIEYALKLGGERVLAFGADFFSPEDFPTIQTKYPGEAFFLEELGNSSCYPAVLTEIQKRGLMSSEGLKRIASQNFFSSLG